MAVDADLFRAGMRRLVGSVCLITTAAPDGTRSGLTATAVTAVSIDPPTLLVCINRQNSTHAAIVGSGFFAVNVLGLEDRPLSDRFASKITGDERFSEGAWQTLATGAPTLKSALVSFDCRIAHTTAVGTHTILFGEIEAIHSRQDGRSLLYAHGSYGGFTPLTVLENPDLVQCCPTLED